MVVVDWGFQRFGRMIAGFVEEVAGIHLNVGDDVLGSGCIAENGLLLLGVGIRWIVPGFQVGCCSKIDLAERKIYDF